MEQATRKSYGPFVFQATGAGQASEFFSLPFSAVRKCNILVAVTDDIDTNSVTPLLPQFMVGLELSIWGRIQGFETPLKTVFTTGKMGPIDFTLADEDGWENIGFKQRMMNGGRPLSPPFGSTAAATAALNNHLSAQVYIMPRTGFKDVING